MGAPARRRPVAVMSAKFDGLVGPKFEMHPAVSQRLGCERQPCIICQIWGDLLMVTQTLTLRLPEPTLRYLQQIATATQRPLEQVVQQSIEGNLPPSVATAPANMQAELLAMQMLPLEALQRIARSQVPVEQQVRHLALLESNSAGDLSPAERAELLTLRETADRLMLRKAYAWAILRWQGQPVPELDELPLEPA